MIEKDKLILLATIIGSLAAIASTVAFLMPLHPVSGVIFIVTIIIVSVVLLRGKGEKEADKKEKLKIGGEISSAVPAPLEIPPKYKDWLRDFHSRLSMDQLAKKGEVITIDLPEVYIPLETVNPFFKGGEQEALKTGKEPKEPSTIDIEALPGRVNLLLLRGRAGMGKTTLVKHLAYTITGEKPPAGAAGYLPVMVFLKELWPIYKKELETPGNEITFESLLHLYLEKNNCPLDMKTISSYLSQNRAFFLFDGLDEVPDSLRGDLVGILHRFRFNFKENSFLCTGRPHGFSTKVVEILGNKIHDIENLDHKKIEAFIIRWFRAVSGRAIGFADLKRYDQ